MNLNEFQFRGVPAGSEVEAVCRLGFGAMTSPSYDWIAHHQEAMTKVLKRELRDLYGQP